MGENVYSWSSTSIDNGSADGSINAIENCPPGVVNDDIRSIMASIAKWRDDYLCRLTSGGSANAQTLTATISYAPAGMVNGTQLGFKAGFTNTGSVTFNVTPSGGSAFGAKTIVFPSNGATASLLSGMIQAGGRYWLNYDSTAGVFFLMNPTPGILPTTTITGPLTVSQNAVLSGTLTVGQSATLQANTVVSGTLTVGQSATLQGNAVVSGSLQATTFTFASNSGSI